MFGNKKCSYIIVLFAINKLGYDSRIYIYIYMYIYSLWVFFFTEKEKAYVMWYYFSRGSNL